MKTISLLAAMFLTAALSGPAAEAGKIPFNGTVAANESYQLFGNPPSGFFVNASGTASSTIGNFTELYTAIVDFGTGGGPDVIRLIASNGDSIFAIAMGQGSDTSDPDVKSIVETETITGGTGRYADAKGGFIVTRLVNVATGVTSGSFHGSIIVRGNPH